jgi:hypothetical protein
MGISMFGAISWRRANRYGALASLLVSTPLFFYLTLDQFGVWLRWDAANFGIALLAGFVALVVVSLATPPEPEEKTGPFYARLNSPSYLNEESGEEVPVTEDGHSLLVVDLFQLRLSEGWNSFMRRYRVDVQGLALAFGVVVVLIIMARAILHLP